MKKSKGTARKEPRAKASGRPRGGGPAAAGGYNFQAAVTGVAISHMLSGTALGWFEGVVFDAPVAVAAETGGGGDDLALLLADGRKIEAQIKKGLRAGRELTEALDRLTNALDGGEIAFGVLVADPNSSRTIIADLAADLLRLADDAEAKVGSQAVALRARLLARGLDVQFICRRLRVVTVPALEGGDAAVRTALALLMRVCERSADAQAAWDRLYRDAHLMMARRGRRTTTSASDVLRSAGIALTGDLAQGPTAFVNRLRDWTLATTAEFTILGVPKPLSIDDAWLPLVAVVRDDVESFGRADLTTALADYHQAPQRPRKKDTASCDPTTLGRFRRLAVVASGPGSGKSTLLKRLARAYARDSHAVLRVSALAVARRMASSGEGFATAAFTLGLEGSSIPPATAIAASIPNWVLLCDGLDECGAQQDAVAEGLLQFAAGHPQARIVATTRTVGYRPAKLAAWRHYDLPVFDTDSAAQRMIDLLRQILPEDQQQHLYRRVKEALEDSDAGRTAARSPLLLSLCAALFARGTPLGRTRVQFYRAVFAMLEAEPPPRADPPPASSAVRCRFLDALGWTVLNDPEAQAQTVMGACAAVLQAELDLPALKARDLADACFTYWEALGVVERVHHDGDAALTFIHKTFGEFAAGRYLAALPASDQARILAERSDPSALSEAIAFASGLGAGPVFLDDLLARGFEGVKGQERLLQALEVLSEAEPAIDAERVDQVVAAALERLVGAHVTWAFEVSEALAVCAHRAPQLIADRVRPLCDHAQDWTRLSAWAVRDATRADQVDLGNLTAAIHSFGELRSGDLRRHLGGGVILIGNYGRDLIQRLAASAAERIMVELPKPQAEQALEAFLPLVNAGTYGFYLRLSDLGSRYGVEVPAPSGSTLTAPFPDLSQVGPAHRQVFTAILAAVRRGVEADGSAAPSEGPLYELAGFFEAIKVGGTTFSDLWGWLKPYESGDVSEVYRHFATLAGLSDDRLAAEAAALQAHIDGDKTEALGVVFSRTPDVDLLDLDPARLAGHVIDFTRVERAMRHRSEIVVEPAVNLVRLTASPDELRKLVSSLLSTCERSALWAGARLAMELPPAEAVDHLMTHALAAARDGSAYVVQALAMVCPVNHHRRLEVLRTTLLGPQVEVAVATADWVCAAPNPAEADEQELLRQAFEHWRTHEARYPTEGGAVPASPRKALAQALVNGQALDLATLRAWSEDSRPDVRGVARTALIDLIGRSGDDRTTFVTWALVGDIGLATLKDALGRPEAFAADEIERLLTLLESQDPSQRFVAMPLLNSQHVQVKTRAEWLGRLQADKESQIREAAIRMIG